MNFGDGTLDVDQGEVNQAQRRTEQSHQHIPPHKDHEQVADPDGNPVVSLYGVVGKHIAQYAAAVERRNGEQVEEAQRKIDQNGQHAQQYECLQARGHAHGDTAAEGGQNQEAPIGSSDRDDGENEKGDQNEQQVGGGAGQGDQIVVADNFAQVAGDDRGGFRPAEQHAAKKVEPDEGSEDDQRGKEQGADGVHVVHGVERDSPHQAGSLVAQPRGHPGVGALMHAEREEEQDELEDGNNEAAGCQTKSPMG